MRLSTLLLAASAGTLLAGCASGGPFNRVRPDEFAVARNPQLIVPPDYALTPPSTGQADPGDPRALNNFAWALLTEEDHDGRLDDLALEAARLANEASGHSVWQYVDTLALAEFRAGNVQAAIALGEKALALVEAAGGDRAEVAAALATYRKAADIESAQVVH